VHSAGPAVPPPGSETVHATDAELQLGPAVFSRLTGMPLEIGGVPIERMGLSLWWPPTDNDLGREWGGDDPRPLALQWREAGLDRLHSRLLGITAGATSDGGEQLVIRTRVGAADKQYGVLVDYTWTSDGDALALRTQVRPQGTWVNAGFNVEWARIGLELVLGGEASTVSWFGQGPHQAYPDTGQGTRTGWFSMALDELDVGYARPQETGARAGVGSAALKLQEGELEISGGPFSLTVRPYSQAVLDAATHRPDLKPDGRTYVYVDHAMRGVGTAACGPGVLEAYRLAPRDADFTIVLRVRP
jgi:beta-galactosidase